jgi:hypothetical protein
MKNSFQNQIEKQKYREAEGIYTFLNNPETYPHRILKYTLKEEEDQK